ncbi:MAG: TM2 domain-containing protein [Bacteroidia bacterium]|nr:TM2 domain-containing protein [Bacteroidia bacterium]MDW8159207.1 TM2 domain-containing protein [Bacteroidia bacterium]
MGWEDKNLLKNQNLPHLHKDTILFVTDYFPENKIPLVLKQLQTVDEDIFEKLKTVQYTNPQTILLISIFLGYLGIDRFMVNDYGLGLFKLLTCGGFGIGWIIDIFLIQNKAKENNFRKLESTIAQLEHVDYQ